MSAEPLKSFYSNRYEPLALRSRTDNTRRLYRNSLLVFERFLERPATLADLNDETVSRFAAWRISQGRSKTTVNKNLFDLLAIWRWAHKKGYVTNWPDVAMEIEPVRSPRAFTAAELAAITAAIHDEQTQVGSFSGPDFWLALFLLCWDTGERIGAVLGLEWERVDLPGRWVRFKAEDRKGQRADNLQQIAADTAEAMAKIKRATGLVFVWPYSRTYIYHRVGKIMVRAGLPDSREFKFHAIRKSTASHYEAAGGNATELLGHSSRKVTESYLDPRIVRPIPAVDLLFRPGDLPAGRAQ